MSDNGSLLENIFIDGRGNIFRQDIIQTEVRLSVSDILFAKQVLPNHADIVAGVIADVLETFTRFVAVIFAQKMFTRNKESLFLYYRTPVGF